MARRITRRERMYKHVLESYLDRGFSLKTSVARAAATVNKYRAHQARDVRTCVKRGRGKWRQIVCRIHRGPRLVTRGGSRRQWYPGKRAALGRRGLFMCLEHERRFRSRKALLIHYRRAHA